ncbi:MAG: hypothetical protein DMG65_08850 [Candidatus Angelobacter sp. Gp1-AA117]|nr:MAG: hypothetical protein DMG65_08850 [Candidatus Angelobacter sp. Gp1-AA117]
MNERHLRYGLLGIVLSSLFSSLVLAQTPLTIGPLTVTVPRGWNAQPDSVPVRLFSPDSTPQQFVSVELLSAQEMQQDLATHHSIIWGRMISLFPSPAPPQSGVTGQFIWAKTEAQRPMGPKETIILYSAKSEYEVRYKK